MNVSSVLVPDVLLKLFGVTCFDDELILKFAFRKLAVPPQLFKVTFTDQRGKTRKP